MTFRQISGDVAFTGSLTASANGPTMVVPGGIAGALLCAVHVSAASGTTPTLAVKLQDSADGTTYADIPGAATAANLTAAGSAVFAGRSTKPYVRAVTTIGGTTPNFTASVTVYGAGV